MVAAQVCQSQLVGRSEDSLIGVPVHSSRVGVVHVSSEGPSSILDVSAGAVVSISSVTSMVGQGSKVNRDSVSPLVSFAQPIVSSVVSVDELDDRVGASKLIQDASSQQKAKGASASGSSNGVCHSNYQGRLKVNLGRAILIERNIDLNNLIESEVPSQVEALGWRQFVTTAHRINERLVREFYAAMDPKEFERGVPVKVRGVDVGFSAQDINVYYGTSNHSDLDSGVPNLDIFRRYNIDLAAELRMPHVVKPWDDKDN
ncbi:hypothetical protein LWI29_008923 [Acer saccharum]|uniref:Uncharacterized protein n=1 Tax=Acer saccharum TaxID=4024 RepID=A0AA39VRD7_ACESA|nr:hypothetical protein LWI29_008923 [Acer saccharum]